MAYATISKPSLHFNTKLWTGTGSSNAITGVGFQPDWTWIKVRSNSTYTHAIYDAVRGVNKPLMSSANNAEGNDASGGNTSLNSFDSDGFTLGGFYNKVNQSGQTFVGWNWKAGNSSGSANTDGNNPNTVTVSANTTAGFSIIKYQGTDTGGQTIGHGLGVKPKLFITKNISEADNWCVWIDTTGNGTADKRLILNSNNGDYGNYFVTFGTSTITLPTQSDNAWNGNGDSFIGYAFAEKKGYSRFGSYTGNGNTNGPFVYTGFKPAFVIIKKHSDTANWMIYDNKREGYNVDNDHLKANNSDQEGTSDDLDLLSNGFKLRTSGSGENSGNFIYMAFAEEPLVANVGASIPATAR